MKFNSHLLMPLLSASMAACAASAQTSTSGGASSGASSGATSSGFSESSASGYSQSSTSRDTGIGARNADDASETDSVTDRNFSDSAIDYGQRQPNIAEDPRDTGFSDSSITTPEEDRLADDETADDRDADSGMRSEDSQFYSSSDTQAGTEDIYDPRDSFSMSEQPGILNDPNYTIESTDRALSDPGLSGRLRSNSTLGGRVYDAPGSRSTYYGALGDTPGDGYGPVYGPEQNSLSTLQPDLNNPFEVPSVQDEAVVDQQAEDDQAEQADRDEQEISAYDTAGTEGVSRTDETGY